LTKWASSSKTRLGWMLESRLWWCVGFSMIKLEFHSGCNLLKN
jgi:hypothetical protein